MHEAGGPGTKPSDDARGPKASPPDGKLALALAASPILVSTGIGRLDPDGRCFPLNAAAVLAALVHVAIIRTDTMRLVASGRF